jgi:hypothetical protein
MSLSETALESTMAAAIDRPRQAASLLLKDLVQAWRRRRREAGGRLSSSLHLRWPRCAFGVCLWRGPGGRYLCAPDAARPRGIKRKAILTWGKRQDKCPSAGLLRSSICVCVRTRRNGEETEGNPVRRFSPQTFPFPATTSTWVVRQLMQRRGGHQGQARWVCSHRDLFSFFI